jgi:hypothetical protein
MIDDLDDGDPGILHHAGRDGGWYAYNDGTGGTQMPPGGMMMPPLPTLGGAAGTKYAMHTSGQGFKTWGAAIGFSFRQPMMMGPPCAYDVSPQKGIRFWLKGKITTDQMGGQLFRVQLSTLDTEPVMQGGTCTGTCNDHYGLNVGVIPAAWTEIEVPFDGLSQQGFGTKEPLDLAHATSLDFITYQGTVYDVWIDQITFY